jgi:puromycin-sensitive aminopeptidase
MFDVLTYEKGAAVVRMLEQYLGAEEFRAGIGAYLRAHAYANTETTDLWDAIEDTVGEPTRRIMDSWIFQAGHPVVAVSLSDDGRTVRLAQQRFRYATRDTSEPPLTSANAVRWAIPVVLRFGRGDATEVYKVLLEEDSIDVNLDQPADWVVGNDRGSGFYRVTYDDSLLDNLAGRAGRDLTALERYSLVEDVWAAVLAGRAGVDRLVGTLRAFADETDLSVWQRIVGVLGALERLVTDDRRADFTAFVRALVGPAAKRLGHERTEGELDRVSSLRAVLFLALAEHGDDETMRERAEELYGHLGTDEASVDPELGQAAVRIVAATADEERFEDLRARSAAATTPQDRLRYLGALADVGDPVLFGRFLAMTMSDEVRTQDAAFLLRRAILNRANGEATWGFVAKEWETLNARLPSAGIPRMLEGIRVVTSAELAEGIDAFLETHPVPQGEKQIEQHRERMWVSVALRDREAQRLADVLA